ncbi:hypothetical protein U6S72_12230, partial [Cutibacterium acnes]
LRHPPQRLRLRDRARGRAGGRAVGRLGVAAGPSGAARAERRPPGPAGRAAGGAQRTARRGRGLARRAGGRLGPQRPFEGAFR